MFVVGFGQFFVPAYFGIKYIGRLKFEESGLGRAAPQPSNLGEQQHQGMSGRGIRGNQLYKDALFPFGILGTFILFMAVFMAGLLAAMRFFEEPKGLFMIFPGVLLMMVLFVFYNFVPSSFEKERTVLRTSTGGGSVFLFNGTWPIFRMLLYSDGVEIRVMFHRLFIPYDKMADIPEKIGFFNRGILIKSNLPGVPSGIRYQGFGLKKLAVQINEYRDKYMGK